MTKSGGMEGVGHAVSVSYSSSVTAFCSGTPMITAASGTITDGSGDLDYNPLTYCGFKIRTNGYSAIKLTFHEFELEEGHDSLHIYKFLNANYTYLTSLTGHIDEGTEMVFNNTNRLFFVFESDEQINAAGFTFDFAGTTETEIHDSEIRSISIWPNPSSSVINVLIGEEGSVSSATLQLCDLLGRKLQERTSVKDGETVSFNVSDLAKGVYLIRVIAEDGSVMTRKIVHQ